MEGEITKKRDKKTKLFLLSTEFSVVREAILLLH